MTSGGYVGTPVRARFTDPRSVAIAGITLGVVAFVLTLPPIEARNMLVPVAVGLLGMMAGVFAASRGVLKLGLLAVGAGLAGVVLGILATRSSASNLEIVFSASLVASMLVFATPLTFAAIGGLFSERSGVVNIGLEGMMLMGAFWAVWGADVTDTWVGGLVIGLLAGGLLASVHAFFSIHLRADQIVSGTAINFLALGITGYFYVELYRGRSVRSDLPTVPNVSIPGIGDIPYIGQFLEPAIGNLNLMVWGAFALVIVAGIVVFKTPIGLRLRACGEHPRAADTVGINVYAIRYAGVITSGILAAAGGAYLSIGYGGGIFTENMTAGRGFIALAALIFGNWRPGGAFAAALLFGFSTALAFRLPVYSGSAATLFQTLPYILTLIAVAGVIGRSRPPAAVGRPYVRQ